MDIQTDLQTAGQPCRRPQVAQAHFFVHEVEVIICCATACIIPPAKQLRGNVPKISIRSKQPSTPVICAACRSFKSSFPTPKSWPHLYGSGQTGLGLAG